MTCVNFKRLSIALLAGLPLLNAGCGGDNLTLPSEGQPASIEVQVDNPSPQVNTTVSVVALVKDTQGRPVEGATVDFVLTDDRGGGHLDPASGPTDGEGKVATTLTLGPQVGPTTGTASVAVADGAAPVEKDFSVTATGTGASTLTIVSGDNQEAAVNSQLSAPLVVKVTDNSGNPVSGFTVQWSAEGGGSVSDASTQTDDNGQASVTRTLGPTAGTQTTVATADGLSGSPATFTHTAKAGNASHIEIVSGNNQEAPAGTQLPNELVVRVLDENNNPVSGRPVAWVIGAGGGSVIPETSNTNGDGQASTHWTLGGSPGSNTVNAVVSGIGSVTFSAQGTGSGSPSNLAVTTQPQSPVVIGATMNPGPVVQVRDAAGHDLSVAGVNITAGLQGSRGQLAGTTTVASDGNGRAQFTDLRVTGATGSYRLIFAADGYRSATSDKFDVVKATTTTAISGQGTSDPGQPVTFNFNVTSTSPGTPSGTVQIKATDSQAMPSEQCTAQAPQGSCQITFTGTGDRQVTATYSGDDSFASSSVTVTQHVNEPAPPPNNPPIANPDTYSATSGQPLTVDAASGVLANDTDPDQNPLTAHLVSGPSAGIVDLHEDGSFTYFPGGLTGTQDSFTYSASDGSLSSNTTVTINVQ